MPFDYTLDFAHTDFRAHPELYRVGKGEQGVLLVEPYKGEILPHWRFRTPEVARGVGGADLGGCLKTIWPPGTSWGPIWPASSCRWATPAPGATPTTAAARSTPALCPPTRRGRAAPHGRPELPRAPEDPEKAAAAAIFKQRWDEARAHPAYQQQRADFQQRYGK